MGKVVKWVGHGGQSNGEGVVGEDGKKVVGGGSEELEEVVEVGLKSKKNLNMTKGITNIQLTYQNEQTILL